MDHKRFDTSRCHNAQNGTYGHECGRPATWIKTAVGGPIPGLGLPDPYTYDIGYCDECKSSGHERHGALSWRRVES